MPPAIRPSRTALTLVELLVVVTILVILVAVVLPLAKPATKGRAIREASRAVSTFLAAAQSKAIATGHPVGVRFDRVNLDSVPTTQRSHVDDVAYRLTEVKMPQPNLGLVEEIVAYPIAGVDVRMRLLLGLPPTPPAILQQMYGSPPGPPVGWDTVLLHALVAIGRDNRLFRVDGLPVGPSGEVGQRIFLGTLDDACENVGVPNQSQATSLPLYPPNQPYPVKFYFGPSQSRMSIAPSIELPIGTCVDLSWSGTGDIRPNQSPRRIAGKFWDNGQHVTVLFAPTGNVLWVYGDLDLGTGNPLAYRRQTPLVAMPNVCGPFRPSSDLYFLVGSSKSRQVVPLTNLYPTSGSLWVTIGHKTGLVSTTENIGSRSIPSTGTPPMVYPESWLFECRTLSVPAIRVGGN